MEFEAWLDQLTIKYHPIREDRRFLMEIWSLDVISKDVHKKPEERRYAQDRLQALMEPKIAPLANEIYQIDGSLKPSESDPIVLYYQLRGLVYAKKIAKARIQEIVNKYPSICREFPPPVQSIEREVERYVNVILDQHQLKQTQRYCESLLKKAHERAAVYRLAILEMSPPYSLPSVEQYVADLGAIITEQEALSEFWKRLQLQSRKISYSIQDRTPPFRRADLEALEQALVEAEAVALEILLA